MIYLFETFWRYFLDIGALVPNYYEFLVCLMGMGYKVEWVAIVIEKVLTGYDNVLGKVKRGETARNRLGAKTAQKRRYKKLIEHD